jgi:hypothetical protein
MICIHRCAVQIRWKSAKIIGDVKLSCICQVRKLLVGCRPRNQRDITVAAKMENPFSSVDCNDL